MTDRWKMEQFYGRNVRLFVASCDEGTQFILEIEGTDDAGKEHATQPRRSTAVRIHAEDADFLACCLNVAADDIRNTLRRECPGFLDESSESTA